MDASPDIRILLIEDNPDVVRVIENYLSASSAPAFSLGVAGKIEGALADLAAGSFDIILLDLDMNGSGGSDDLGHVMANTQLPVIALTASQNDTVVLAAIRKGAQDCLVKGSLESDQIRRAIRCAIERHRQHPESPRQLARQAQERQRESDHLQAFCLQTETPISNQAHGAIPLRDSLAQVFGDMVARYADVLDQALVVRAYKTDNGLSRTLQALAAELGSLRAGPRDVIDIHTTALKQKVRGAPAPKAQAYAGEARMTLLEVMGHLAGHYRSYCLRQCLFGEIAHKR